MLPDTANQPITVSVTGLPYDTIIGEDLYLEVGSDNSGPEISGADFVTGTPFSANSPTIYWQGDIDTKSYPSRQVWLSASYLTQGVYADNSKTILATLYVDTTGLGAGSGSWTLYGSVDGTANFPMDFMTTGSPLFAPTDITVNDGTLRIAAVPEPGTLALLVAAIGVVPVLLIRKRMRAAR